jgi:DNA repair exonuclease SbcCD ATPase subunit
MKEFIIKKMALANFKSQTRTIEFNDKITRISGCNGIGKTTIYKAFAWLFTSYTDALNVKNHELFDMREELTHETPEASVKAWIEIDGIEYTIERKAKAKFSRKRGSTEWTKDSSDSYTILIDDIETSASDFNAWVNRVLGNVDLLVYMIIGERFANLAINDKNKARDILEELTGEIKLSDMKGDYTRIVKDLMKYPVEELIERYKNQLKPIKKRLDTVNALIELKDGEVVDYDEKEYIELEREINAKTSEINEIDKEILDDRASFEKQRKERSSVFREIQAKKDFLLDKENELKKNALEKKNELSKKIMAIDFENQFILVNNKNKREEYERNVEIRESVFKQLESWIEKREMLVEKKNETKRRVFSETKCSYCGQELPYEILEKGRNKFIEQKKKDLDEIVEQGKFAKKMIDELSKKLEELDAIIGKGVEETPLIDKSELEDEFKNIKDIDFKTTDVYISTMNEIKELEERVQGTTECNHTLLEKKEELMNELQSLNRKYGKKAVMVSIIQELESLKKERIDLGIQIANCEGNIEDCKMYLEERANIISERINEKLDDCKVVMYSRQKNGELAPDCVIVNNDGVKYSTLNNSARIKMYLSLQRLFCKHFDVNMPVFIDESSIFDSTHLPLLDAQTIYLFASDDKTLKVE